MEDFSFQFFISNNIINGRFSKYTLYIDIPFLKILVLLYYAHTRTQARTHTHTFVCS